jgi:inner membrane protein YhjD
VGVSSSVQNLVTQAKLRVEKARARYGLIDITVGTLKRYSVSDGGSYSAALTYYIFFSIFPLLIFAASVLGYLTFGNQDLQRNIFDAAVESFPMLEEAFNEEAFAFFERRRQELALTGAALALYSGSGAIVALEHALNKVHRTGDEGSFVDKRLRSLKWLVVLGVSALVSVALSTIGGLARGIFGSTPVVGAVLGGLFILLGVAVSVGVFATAFRYLPVKRESWRDVLPGAVVAAVGFELMKGVGRVFVESGSGSRSATFGVFATAATLLVVTYLVSQVTLLAAEVNAVLEERRITRQSATSSLSFAEASKEESS